MTSGGSYFSGTGSGACTRKTRCKTIEPAIRSLEASTTTTKPSMASKFPAGAPSRLRAKLLLPFRWQAHFETDAINRLIGQRTGGKTPRTDVISGFGALSGQQGLGSVSRRLSIDSNASSLNVLAMLISIMSPAPSDLTAPSMLSLPGT